jgi:hypothetical protein
MERSTAAGISTGESCLQTRAKRGAAQGLAIPVEDRELTEATRYLGTARPVAMTSQGVAGARSGAACAWRRRARAVARVYAPEQRG